MKTYILDRIKYDTTQTKGILYDYDNIELCKTLELPWLNNQRRISCIPEGEYTVIKRYSQKYKHHFHILDVEERSWILIHQGNFAGSLNPKTGKSDILGCVLVGERFLDIDGDGIKDITNSVNTMNFLNQVLPNKFKLIIKS